MANTSYSAAITRTLQKHGKRIFDNISTNNTVLYQLRKRGNIKLSEGGRVFTHPLYYVINTSFGSYAPLAAIRTPVMNDYTRAEYPIKVVAGSLIIDDLELAKNQGSRERLLNYGETVRKAGEISMEETMGDQVFNDGSGANDFDGIPHLINNAPSTQSDVGGIDPSSYSYWRNQVGSAVSAFNTSNEGRDAMNALVRDCTFGRRGPTAVITTKTIHALYEASMTSSIRYLSTTLDEGDRAFTNLAYRTMPVMFDDNCTTDVLYMIDFETLWLQLLSQGNFQVTPFEPSHNQFSETALMKVYGNLTCGSRRTQGYLAVTG